MVWNPYCLQPKWFEPDVLTNNFFMETGAVMLSGTREKKVLWKYCGHSHKILRFKDNIAFPGDLEKGVSWYEIYDFESDSWKTLDVTRNWRIWFNEHGVSVKGSTYWCVREENADNFHVLCFDFTRERFGPLMLVPYYIRVGHNYNVRLLSCVREEKLAALLHHRDIPNVFDVEVWITTEIDAEKFTWSKFFTVNMKNDISSLLESFIIDEEKKLVIVGYGVKICIFGESGYFRELVFEQSDNKCDWPYLCAYVLSLVQIEQAAAGKMIEQDNAEKCRCDENMERLAAYERLMESKMYRSKNNSWFYKRVLL